MSVPLDWEKVEALFDYIAKRRAWHHWKVCPGADYFVSAHPRRACGVRVVLDLAGVAVVRKRSSACCDT
jgi:hypothetical protein